LSIIPETALEAKPLIKPFMNFPPLNCVNAPWNTPCPKAKLKPQPLLPLFNLSYGIYSFIKLVNLTIFKKVATIVL